MDGSRAAVKCGQTENSYVGVGTGHKMNKSRKSIHMHRFESNP